MTVGAITVLGQGISLAQNSSSPKVIGTNPTDPGVKNFSTYWWYKAKVTYSQNNPGGSVTVYVAPAGAEKGAGFPEQVGGCVEIAGSVDSMGNFTGTKDSRVGFISTVAIGYLPNLPTPVTPVDVKIKITAFTETPSEISMSGVVWAESSPTVGGTTKSSEDAWMVKVAKI